MIRIVEGMKCLIDGVLCFPGEVHRTEDPFPFCEKHDINIFDTDIFFSRDKTIAGQMLSQFKGEHDPNKLYIRFETLVSPDTAYVAIMQSAIASGIKSFGPHVVFSNCHNSLCAVGGTINSDDHAFGLSVVQKYGGDFVPPFIAVIHQYVREMVSECGKMILGADSHTRYGPLGMLGFGEGGPEIVKQLFLETYNIPFPKIVAVYLSGCPHSYVGPHDVALALLGATRSSNFLKNKILEFIGPGVKNLSVDFRIGIDVMTTEMGGVSSIWVTDEEVKKYYADHGRPQAFRKFLPRNGALYDGVVYVDLDKIQPMIGLPFHPSNVFTIEEFNSNPLEAMCESFRLSGQSGSSIDSMKRHLEQKIKCGRIVVDQGVIGGCCGGLFDNIKVCAEILEGKKIGNGNFSLNIYPASQSINIELQDHNITQNLIRAGANVGSSFCGPCYGVCDTPQNGAFSIRHVTRNFKNREGAQPDKGQHAMVALMDSRSIAASATNFGRITSAADTSFIEKPLKYKFWGSVYEGRVYSGRRNPKPNINIKYGPSIKPWPQFPSLQENLLLNISSVLKDPILTTDDLLPAGEVSTYRSDPFRLADFTLSRKDPGYVNRTKEIKNLDKQRTELSEGTPPKGVLLDITEKLLRGVPINQVSIGSVIVASRIGDGSAREQAVSSQKILGGLSNIAEEYVTKRYFNNLINWGIIPFIINGPIVNKGFDTEMWLFIPQVKSLLRGGRPKTISAQTCDRRFQPLKPIELIIPDISDKEADIIIAGGIINVLSA